MAAADGPLEGFWSRILGSGYDAGPAAGRAAGGPRSPGFPFLLDGVGFGWSGGMRYRVDVLPGGGDLVCPGPGAGDLEVWVPKTCATWEDALGIAVGSVKWLGSGRAGPGSAGGGMIFGLWA